MYRFQLKIILHTKNQEVAKLMKRTIIRCQNQENRKELSDEDYKVAMIKMIQQIIMYMLETEREPQQRNTGNDNQMESLELKNTITEIKNSVDRLTNRVKGTEERLSEIKEQEKSYYQNNMRKS